MTPNGGENYGRKDGLQNVDTDRAVVSMATMFRAVCTCGWEQLHTSDDNATIDAEYHQREWHGD